MSDKPIVSHSGLQNVAVCPAKNFFKREVRAGRIEQKKVDPAYKMVYGSATHRGIEKRLKGESDNPLKDAAAYLEENLFDVYGAEQLDKGKIVDAHENMVLCLQNFEREFYPSLMQTITDPEHEVEVTLRVPYGEVELLGVLDLCLIEPRVSGDWKTGLPPKQGVTMNGSQHKMYYLMEGLAGLTPFDDFIYCYLQGTNIRQIQVPYKTGPRKGELHWIADKDNPEYIYSHHVKCNDEIVAKWKREYLDPLIKVYTRGDMWRRGPDKTDIICRGCQYFNICVEYDIPVAEGPIVLDVAEPEEEEID